MLLARSYGKEKNQDYGYDTHQVPMPTPHRMYLGLDPVQLKYLVEEKDGRGGRHKKSITDLACLSVGLFYFLIQ